MDAINSATISNSSLVLGQTKPEQQTSSLLKDTTAPKDTNQLVSKTVAPSPNNISNVTANVAAPAVAVPLQPSQLSNVSLQASNLGSVTSVDALVKQNNDRTASEINEIVSQPLARDEAKPLNNPVESNDDDSLVEPAAQQANSPITDTRKSNEQTALAVASNAYTTTANYGQSGQGGSGSFSLAV